MLLKFAFPSICLFPVGKFIWRCASLLDNQELNVFKNTKEDVKKYIYDELDYCIANLPAIRPNESEHPGAVTNIPLRC